MAEMSVGVTADVEFTVGDKTKAWLVALGWTPPVEDPAPVVTDGAGTDMVVNTRAPYTSLPEAHEAMNGREAAKYQALTDYQAMLTELSSPERLTNLLTFFGVRMDRFLEQKNAIPDA